MGKLKYERVYKACDRYAFGRQYVRKIKDGYKIIVYPPETIYVKRDKYDEARPIWYYEIKSDSTIGLEDNIRRAAFHFGMQLAGPHKWDFIKDFRVVKMFKSLYDDYPFLFEYKNDGGDIFFNCKRDLFSVADLIYYSNLRYKRRY